VKELIEAGANVHAVDINGGTALMYACWGGNIDIVKELIDAGANVDAVDINERDLNLAKKNAELNKVNINIFESDIYSNVEGSYDYIITNPPIRVGKKILYEILFKAKEHLNKNGELWLVIHKDQGAKTLVKDLEKEYQVEVKNKNKGFYIICARNN
jgi:16S rRNA (guanine1207-N2)-methyltransferase